ncbi:MAG: hypothetical protein HHAS10_01690 [Candidatus Altimarinota bacterium]
MKKILLLATLLLLSSCMKFEGEIQFASDGTANTKASVDMTKFMVLMEAFGSGSNTSTINKNLCLDENFSGGLSEGMGKSKVKMNNFQCTSLGDYKVQITGDLDYRKQKGIIFQSGGTIVADLLLLGDGETTPSSSERTAEGTKEAEDMGFSMSQKYTFPGKVSFIDAGTITSDNTVSLNLLDSKILNRRSLIVIVTSDGRKLSRKEINGYKLQLKKYNRTIQ